MRCFVTLLAVWALLLSGGCGNGGSEPPSGGTGPVAPSASGTNDVGLLKALGSDDETARLAAIDALGQQGGQIEGAIPALIEQLDDDSATVRAHAAHALGEIGSAAKSAAEALANLAFDKEASVRREAIGAYRKIGPGPEISIPLFTKLFEEEANRLSEETDPNEADSQACLHVMQAMAEEGKEIVPALITALKSDDAAYWACLVLTEIGPDAEEAVGPLTKLFQSHEDPEVRREAVLALAAIGPGAAGAVPALIGVLDSDENENLLDGPAIYALGAIGPKAKEAQDRIRKLADDEDAPDFRRTIGLWALARMNPDDQELAREVVPRLVQALKAPEPMLRAAAARALIDLDADPEIVRPEMQKAMEEADPAALNDMLDALASLGEKAVPRLIVALETEEIRPKAAAIIARIGPPAKAAVPALIKALEDKNPVLFALAAIGPDAAEAVTAISQALGAPETNVCYSACFALGKIGPAAESAKAALEKNLVGDDHFLCMASAWALCHIAPKSPETAAKAVPVLIEALGEPDAMTRGHAAESLELFGPLAGDAVEALKKLHDDPDEEVRAAAAKALKAIGQ